MIEGARCHKECKGGNSAEGVKDERVHVYREGGKRWQRDSLGTKPSVYLGKLLVIGYGQSEERGHKMRL